MVGPLLWQAALCDHWGDMRTYRAHAELRRLHAEGDWWLAGVLVEGNWHPIKPGIRPPNARGIEAQLVSLQTLPPILARDDRQALSIARWSAMGLGYPLWRMSHTSEERISL